MNVEKGLYRHWKGKTYEVLGTAWDVVYQWEVVVYKPCGEDTWIVRGLEEFCEWLDPKDSLNTVSPDAYFVDLHKELKADGWVPRFELIP